MAGGSGRGRSRLPGGAAGGSALGSQTPERPCSSPELVGRWPRPHRPPRVTYGPCLLLPAAWVLAHGPGLIPRAFGGGCQSQRAPSMAERKRSGFPRVSGTTGEAAQLHRPAGPHQAFISLARRFPPWPEGLGVSRGLFLHASPGPQEGGAQAKARGMLQTGPSPRTLCPSLVG